MEIFEDIIAGWLILGGIVGFLLGNKSQMVKTWAWVIFMLVTPFVPFFAYLIAESI